MAPGQRISIQLFSMAKDFEKKLSGSVIEVTVTYRNSIGRPYVDKYYLDLSRFVGMIYRKPGTLKDVAYRLEAIENSLNRLRDEVQPLSVVVEKRGDYLCRLAEQEEERHRELEELNQATDWR